MEKIENRIGLIILVVWATFTITVAGTMTGFDFGLSVVLFAVGSGLFLDGNTVKIANIQQHVNHVQPPQKPKMNTLQVGNMVYSWMADA